MVGKHNECTTTAVSRKQVGRVKLGLIGPSGVAVYFDGPCRTSKSMRLQMSVDGRKWKQVEKRQKEKKRAEGDGQVERGSC